MGLQPPLPLLPLVELGCYCPTVWLSAAHSTLACIGVLSLLAGGLHLLAGLLSTRAGGLGLQGRGLCRALLQLCHEACELFSHFLVLAVVLA